MAWLGVAQALEKQDNLAKARQTRLWTVQVINSNRDTNG
jgi:hypothetical protein